MYYRSLYRNYLKHLSLLVFVGFVFPQKIIISGEIFNKDKKPIKKARILLLNLKDEILIENYTNRKGRFELENIDPKFYYLTAENDKGYKRRIKINPRKLKNENLHLVMELDDTDYPINCYLFGNEPPTLFDPILNIKDIEIKIDPGFLSINWGSINQAKLYTLFENGKKVYVGGEDRFEKSIPPGVEFCYSLKASGDYGLEGEKSLPKCVSSPTTSPRDIKVNPLKNSISLSWPDVLGATSYAIYRNDSMIAVLDDSTFQDTDLLFSKDYYYKITAINALDEESSPSVEVKSKTHEYVEVPILSSMNTKTNIALIWNEVQFAESYNIYRENELISNTISTSFSDPLPPGKEYCYQVSSVDKYNIETSLSNLHCTKVLLQPPKGVQADSDVTSIHLNWNEVPGADHYLIYERINQDSVSYIGESKSTQFTVKSLDFSADLCFVITSIDMDGIESDFSTPACNVVFDPPNFSVSKFSINDISGNNIIDARESGSLVFAILNDGQSPAHNVKATVIPKKPDLFLLIGKPFVVDTLDAGRIKYFEIQIKGMLQLESGVHDFELEVTSKENISLKLPYTFKVETKCMIPPKMIIADFAVSNEFGTQYIPKNEIVDLTIRIQNVGEGETESVTLIIKENRTFTTPDFNGSITLPMFRSGDYMDVEIPIKSNQDNFSIQVEIIDYLGKKEEKRIDLETMRNYRTPMQLTIQDIGVDEIIYYPDELGEVDVDRRVPVGRKNPNGLAVILGSQYYDDKRYEELEYVDRDKQVMRKYFSQAFGLSDFQILPSKPWQMDGGPTSDEYRIIFDYDQGDLKKRVLSAVKYSDMDDIDIFVYFRGYGEWVDGRPLIIPKDAQYDRHITKYPFEELIINISRLSVLNSINTITLFLDITYLNPEKSSGLLWDFPKLPEKISILSSASNGETSQIFKDKKHSFFTYSLLKGLSGNADDGDDIISLGELTDYIYKSIPENLRKQPGSLRQNPKFNGTDLKRIILDMR